MRTFLSIIVLTLLAALASEARAQIPGEPLGIQEGPGELVDRVAAVVGDSIVLYTEVLDELARLEAQLRAEGQALPEDPESRRELEREILQELVNDLLLLQAAERDTLVEISDARVDDALRDAWEDQIRRVGSEDELRRLVEARGETLAQYRAGMRNQIRRRLMVDSYIQLQRSGARPVAVDEAEVREIWDRERANLDRRPATLAFRHLFFEAVPADSVKEAARERAMELLEMLQQGEDFAALARRFSDDPGSAAEGGDLGWYRRGDGLVEEFEDVAFALRQGQTSGVVETSFGAHIIRVERVRGAERRILHILVATERSDADLERARERAAEVAERIRQGASMDEFRDESARVGIPDSLELATNALDQFFPPGYVQALRSAGQGDIVGPVEFPLGQEAIMYAVARIKEVRDEGAYTFEDVSAQIRTNLREMRFRERILDQVRQRTYVDIRL